jgi:hypothetical protein
VMLEEINVLHDLLDSHIDHGGRTDVGWELLRWPGSTLNGFTTITTVEGENGDWARDIMVITEGPTGETYGWFFMEGLTEIQDDYRPSYVVHAAILTTEIIPVHTWSLLA